MIGLAQQIARLTATGLGWTYCPRCRAKLFWGVLIGEIKCRKCNFLFGTKKVVDNGTGLSLK